MADSSTALDQARAELVGWAIVGIAASTQAEAMFTLVLEKGGQRKRITVFATDLGWWLGKAQKAGTAAAQGRTRHVEGH